MRHRMIGGALMLAVMLLPLSAGADTVFRLETPQPGATVFGIVEVAGWIADDGQECGPPPEWRACDWTDALVSSIALYVDNTLVATADLNQPRYDVLQAYPWYAGTPFERPGFSASFDASTLSDGEHLIYVAITFSDDMRVEKRGHRRVMVDNHINQAPFGELELPGDNQPMNAVFPLSGWALDDGHVAKIEVLIDGQSIGGVASGFHRPDIAHRFPSHDGAEYSGFRHMLNTTAYANGMHLVAVRLTDNEGATRIIGRRFVQVFNTGYNLPPFGAIDYPLPNHVMYGQGCTDPGGWSTPPFEELEVAEFVTGWALDVSPLGEAEGVAYLELLIDGVIVADTYEPVFWSVIGQYADVYGLPRMDIWNLYPNVFNSKDAGFMFRLDMSDLILPTRRAFGPGLHYLKVRGGDLENHVADIAMIPVWFMCDDIRDNPSWGDITAPEENETITGVYQVKGWVIDPNQAVKIEIWDSELGFVDYVDGYGEETPDVAAMFPWLPSYQTHNAGFYYNLDTVALNMADGEHHLVIWTEDYWGGRNMIGERVYYVDNLKK